MKCTRRVNRNHRMNWQTDLILIDSNRVSFDDP
jgi:hypothetical protein